MGIKNENKISFKSLNRLKLVNAVNAFDINNINDIIKNGSFSLNDNFYFHEIEPAIINFYLENCHKYFSQKNNRFFGVTEYSQFKKDNIISLSFILSLYNQADLIEYMLEKENINDIPYIELEVRDKRLSLEEKEKIGYLNWAILHDNKRFLDIFENFIAKDSKEIFSDNIIKKLGDYISFGKNLDIVPLNLIAHLINENYLEKEWDLENKDKFIELVSLSIVDKESLELFCVLYSKYKEENRFFDYLSKITSFCSSNNKIYFYSKIINFLEKEGVKNFFLPKEVFLCDHKINNKNSFTNKIIRKESFKEKLMELDNNILLKDLDSIYFSYENLDVFDVSYFTDIIEKKHINKNNANLIKCIVEKASNDKRFKESIKPVVELIYKRLQEEYKEDKYKNKISSLYLYIEKQYIFNNTNSENMVTKRNKPL